MKHSCNVPCYLSHLSHLIYLKLSISSYLSHLSHHLSHLSHNHHLILSFSLPCLSHHLIYFITLSISSSISHSSSPLFHPLICLHVLFLWVLSGSSGLSGPSLCAADPQALFHAEFVGLPHRFLPKPRHDPGRTLHHHPQAAHQQHAKVSPAQSFFFLCVYFLPDPFCHRFLPNPF